MDFREYLKSNTVILDGGMGTLLQEKGLMPGELPERWNVSRPEVIREIHKAYFDAGSNVVSTNTFGANLLKFSREELDVTVKCAVENARFAREACTDGREKFIALDIGPSGKMLKPYGDLDFEDAVSLFADTVRLGVKYGVDFIFIETMSDSYETKAALLAAKENSDLPVLVSNAYGEDGKLMTGASPMAMVALLEGMGADAIGANCSLGPRQLRGVCEELLEYASVPVLVKPNAGLPKSIDGKTHYDVLEDEFAREVTELCKKGVRLAGGCCGTTPSYIKALAEMQKDVTPVPVTDKRLSLISSYTHAVCFGTSPILIGERINPTGKKRFKKALVENDLDFILGEGINQQEKGVHVLDVNVGLPDIDEAQMLTRVVCELQSVTSLPLQIDSSDTVAMEKALRRYNGKAMINSVNGKGESMEAVFPLVKKYGGLVVALTLDEDGIPDTAEKRLEVARKILSVASSYGISSKDIIFDPLAMTVSADKNAGLTTLRSVGLITEELGCLTSLGVSNVSFGLPCRDTVNSTFFALALERGLSAAIMNPYSSEMMKTYFAYRALHGLDENCADYISASENFEISVPSESSPNTAAVKSAEISGTELQGAIIKGLRDKAGEITEKLLESTPPLDIVNHEVIPALDTVGVGFEKKTVYLPQLLMSAEAAKCAFEKIKCALSAEKSSELKGPFVLATVKGDIHDIGKNIVKLLLENYGFFVIDLGKDVPGEEIANTVRKYNAPICGLSALMTTTLPSMEDAIRMIRETSPQCKIVVGGAVLNRDYAEKLGADKYARDAMETVRYAEETVG